MLFLCNTGGACGLFFCKLVFQPFCAWLSSQSSAGTFPYAQRNYFRVIARLGFPHFHSDGYYYYLYTYTKKGYSSSSQK
jgi:hypothetical protein